MPSTSITAAPPFPINNTTPPQHTNHNTSLYPMNYANPLSKKGRSTPSSKKNKATPEHLLDNKTGMPIIPNDNILREATDLWDATSDVSSGPNNTQISRRSTTSLKNSTKPSRSLPGDISTKQNNTDDGGISESLKAVITFFGGVAFLVIVTSVLSRFSKKNTDSENRNITGLNFRTTARSPSTQSEDPPPPYEMCYSSSSLSSWTVLSAESSESYSILVPSGYHQSPTLSESPPPPYTSQNSSTSESPPLSYCQHIASITSQSTSTAGLQNHGFVADEVNPDTGTTESTNNSAVPTNLNTVRVTITTQISCENSPA